MGRFDDLQPARPARTAELPDERGPLVDLSDKEAAAYSITRAMEAVGTIGGSRPRRLETEISDELERKLAPYIVRQSSGPGLWMPTDPRIWLQRALLSTTGATQGAELVVTESAGFLPMLRGKSLVVSLGAQVLTGLRGRQLFPRQTARMTAQWMAESPTADVASSAMTMTDPSVEMVPKGLLAVTSVTRMLAQQSRPAADRLVMDELRREFGTTVDKAAIQGTGTLQPTGILNTAGINTVAIGVNGGVPTYDHLVDMEFEIAVDDADLGSLGLLTTPKVRQRLRKSAAVSASTGVPAWVGNQVLGGIRAEVTTNVPANLTKGTSTTIAHGIILGQWADGLVLGEWGALEILVDPFALKRRGDLEISAILHTDVGVVRPTSFCAILDALP